MNRDTEQIKELERKQSVSFFYGAGMGLSAYFAIGLYLIGKYIDERCKIAAGVCLLLFFVFCYMRAKLRVQFWDIFWQQVIVELGKHMKQVKLDGKSGFTEAEIKRLGMTVPADHYSSNHQVSGIYHGLTFRDATIRIEKRVPSRRRNSYDDYFWGRMFVCENMTKDLPEVMIRTMLFHHWNEGIIPAHRCEIEELKRGITMSVYIEKEADEERFFTPAVVEKINQLNNTVFNLAIRFYDGKMIVQYTASSGKVREDHFHRRQFGTMTEKIEKDANELLTILELAETVRAEWEKVS